MATLFFVKNMKQHKI